MIVFATIFGIGFLILLFSLIFGHDTDVSVDADVSGDLGGDVSHGPSVYSAKIVALLMVGFGATGFGFKVTTDWSTFQVSMAGIAGALFMGVLGYIVLRMFYASQASSTINDSDVLGRDANVIDAIHGNEYGQVTCIIMGREITFLARTGDGTTVPRNTPVRIVSKSGNIVTVVPVNIEQQ